MSCPAYTLDIECPRKGKLNGKECRFLINEKCYHPQPSGLTPQEGEKQERSVS